MVPEFDDVWLELSTNILPNLPRCEMHSPAHPGLSTLARPSWNCVIGVDDTGVVGRSAQTRNTNEYRIPVEAFRECWRRVQEGDRVDLSPSPFVRSRIIGAILRQYPGMQDNETTIWWGVDGSSSR